MLLVILFVAVVDGGANGSVRAVKKALDRLVRFYCIDCNITECEAITRNQKVKGFGDVF